MSPRLVSIRASVSCSSRFSAAMKTLVFALDSCTAPLRGSTEWVLEPWPCLTAVVAIRIPYPLRILMDVIGSSSLSPKVLCNWRSARFGLVGTHRSHITPDLCRYPSFYESQCGTYRARSFKLVLLNLTARFLSSFLRV